MTDDITQLLSDKETEITSMEAHLETVSSTKDAIEREITEMRIRVSELNLAIKKREQDVESIVPAIRQAKRNITRFKREHGKLFREYMKERDMAKGMR